jgi:hypothetical protein
LSKETTESFTGGSPIVIEIENIGKYNLTCLECGSVLFVLDINHLILCCAECRCIHAYKQKGDTLDEGNISWVV